MDGEFVFFAALPISPHGSCEDRRQMSTSTDLNKGKLMSSADPNVVIVTGENPFIRLSVTDSDDYTTNASFWRIIFSPAGPGHVLYLKSELTENRWRIYADNIAMARWLQSTVQGMLNAELLDTTIPVVDAEFSKTGDSRYFWTERAVTQGEEVTLTWYDIGDPLLIHTQPNSVPGRRYGVCTVWCRRLARDCPATASRRPDNLGSGSVKAGHSALARWHSPKAGPTFAAERWTTTSF